VIIAIVIKIWDIEIIKISKLQREPSRHNQVIRGFKAGTLNSHDSLRMIDLYRSPYFASNAPTEGKFCERLVTTSVEYTSCDDLFSDV